MCPGCPPPAKLVPHVSLDGLDFATFFGDDEEGEGGKDGEGGKGGEGGEGGGEGGGSAREERAGKLLFTLLQQAVTLGLDGFVLDAHASLARYDRPTRLIIAPRLHIFVQLLAHQLSLQAAESHSEKPSATEGGGSGGRVCCGEGLHLVVPPHPELFSPSQFAQLAKPLGGFVLSTANYSAVKGEPGPSAPLSWIRDAVSLLGAEVDEPQALSKIMAALPLHGWDFALPDGQGSAVGAQRYLALLAQHPGARLEWHADAAEHVFAYSSAQDGRKHALYYPSLRGVSERLGLLRRLGVGLALWEIGSGLDYFWDLL